MLGYVTYACQVRCPGLKCLTHASCARAAPLSCSIHTRATRRIWKGPAHGEGCTHRVGLTHVRRAHAHKPGQACACLSVPAQAWKSLQLAVLTLWNACARNGNMERHVVEHGVCERLLDIINSPLWPPSLRDMACGCLEFFMERCARERARTGQCLLCCMPACLCLCVHKCACARMLKALPACARTRVGVGAGVGVGVGGCARLCLHA